MMTIKLISALVLVDIYAYMWTKMHLCGNGWRKFD